MAKRLKKYWKIGLIMGLMMVLVNVTIYANRNALISYVGMKMVDAQTSAVDPAAAKVSVANTFCILFVGNSITRHGMAVEALNWDHVSGMAASSEDKDFVHRLSALIQATMPDRKIEIYFDNVNQLLAQKGTVNPIADKSFPPPNLVVIQTGEHEVPGKTREAIAEIYEQGLVKPYVDLTPKPLILCTGVWSPSDNVPYGGYILDVNEAYKSVCAKYNIPFASVESFATDPTCRGFGTNGGVQWHPNDKGMKGYADSLFKAFQQIKNQNKSGRGTPL